MQTGYFFDIKTPDKPSSKIHVVDNNNVPLCGTKEVGEFYWCASGIKFDYINCEKCKEIAGQEIIKTHKTVDELCPFCKSDMWSYKAFHVVHGNEEHDEFVVYCTNCGAQGPNELSRTAATKAWNMRRKKAPNV